MVKDFNLYRAAGKYQIAGKAFITLARLKDEFGGRMILVRGYAKVMTPDFPKLVSQLQFVQQ
jgi:hypothetical protein